MSEKRNSKELKELVKAGQGKTLGRRVVAGFMVGVRTTAVVATVAAVATAAIALPAATLTGCTSSSSSS